MTARVPDLSPDRRAPAAARGLHRTAAAVLLAAACSAAHASPDTVRRFLAEHGLAAAEDTPQARAAPRGGLIDQMRGTASELVVASMNFIGVPYRYGGQSEDEGFDCSGFTRHVFSLALGLVLPRRSDEQAMAAGLVDIARDELAPGDLVFFNTLRRTFSHVGIYVGGGRFIHAPRSGAEVRIEDMRNSYWTRRFDGARRLHASVLNRGT